MGKHEMQDLDGNLERTAAPRCALPAWSRVATVPLRGVLFATLAAACTEPPSGGLDEEGGSSPGASSLPAPGTSSAPSGTGTPVPSAPVSTGALTPAPSEAGPQPALPMDRILEDFGDGDGSLASAELAVTWRTYSDLTGTLTPAVGMPVVPMDGSVHVSGSGFTTWGAGLSVDLSGTGAARQPVDLSAYRGLSIRARGTGSVDVELVLPATTGTDEGGSCTGDNCFGHYAGSLTLGADYADTELTFASLRQPDWAQAAELDLTQVLAINFLSRANGGAASIDLWLDEVHLLSAAPPPVANPFEGGAGTVADPSNPFAGRTLYSEGGAAAAAYNAAQGMERELLAKIALQPTAFWLPGSDPSRAGGFAAAAGGDYPVLVAYNIPNRDCSGESAGGAGSPEEYQRWIDGVSSSLQGREAAVILEPDALALSCGASTEGLIAYAVSSLRRNPDVAVYIDGGHSNWVPASQMAGRLQNAGIAEATGFALNVSNFQPTQALIDYGRSLSALVGNKPFVIDTSRNGQGARGSEWCNPAGAGLGEAPTTNTGDPLVHALLWVKRPGESDGQCGQCGGTSAGQFCQSYALELARNAVF